MGKGGKGGASRDDALIILIDSYYIDMCLPGPLPSTDPGIRFS